MATLNIEIDYSEYSLENLNWLHGWLCQNPDLFNEAKDVQDAIDRLEEDEE